MITQVAVAQLPVKPHWYTQYTLHGVDSDHDGVRDDIEIWINNKHQDHNVRRALRKIAKVYTAFFKVKNSQKRDEVLLSHYLANTCLSFVSPYQDTRHTSMMKKELEEKILDNPWRRFMFKNNSTRGKDLFILPKYEFYEEGIACSFKVEGLWKLIERHLKRNPLRILSEGEKLKIRDMYELNPYKYDAREILGFY